jgi:HK97 family phage portal protein
MAWYNGWKSWFVGSGNTRKKGDQTSAPNSYPEESAAPVTFDSAMTVSAFWASSRLLSETLAAMPINCFENMSDGSRQKNKSYKLWRLLNFQPNRRQTRIEFFESLMLNLVTDGNCYAYIQRSTRGISSILPLMSAQMCVTLEESGEVTYTYLNSNGTYTAYSQADIWHVKLFGNGLVGMSPLAFARNSLGIAISTDNRVGNLAKNGGKASGVLSIDRVLTPQQRDAVRKNMEEIAKGDSDNLKILEADMKYQQISLSPQDLQLLESRRFQVEDIARFMGVPSVLINDTAGSTVWGSGVEQLIGGFYKLNMKPYLERFESSIKRWLTSTSDWEKYDIEFDFDSLLRADPKTRAETNSISINSGQMSPNEARNSEGREDKEGGDQIYLNGSLVQAGTNNSGVADNENNPT